MIDPKNCNYITFVECISSVGKTIWPILLISRINILYKGCQHNDLNSNIVINIMKTSYANNDNALE